jgi:hypothetical protein
VAVWSMHQLPRRLTRRRIPWPRIRSHELTVNMSASFVGLGGIVASAERA